MVHDGVTVGGNPQTALLLYDSASASLGITQEVNTAVSIVGASTGDPALVVQGGKIASVEAIETDDYLKAERMYWILQTRTYAATMSHDIRNDNYLSTISLTGNLTFSLANITAGFKCEVRIKSDGSIRNLAFPVGWVFIGSAVPATIAASKTGLLEIWCYGTTDADVVARWTVQP